MVISLHTTKCTPNKIRRNTLQDLASRYFQCLLVAPSLLASTLRRSTQLLYSWLGHRSDLYSFMELGEVSYMRSRIQTLLSRSSKPVTCSGTNKICIKKKSLIGWFRRLSERRTCSRHSLDLPSRVMSIHFLTSSLQKTRKSWFIWISLNLRALMSQSWKKNWSESMRKHEKDL